MGFQKLEIPQEMLGISNWKHVRIIKKEYVVQKYQFQDCLLWTPYCAFGNLAQNDIPDHLRFLIA